MSQEWDLGEINNVMSLLSQRKQLLERGMKVAETRMLKNFLEEVRDRKQRVGIIGVQILVDDSFYILKFVLFVNIVTCALEKYGNFLVQGKNINKY